MCLSVCSSAYACLCANAKKVLGRSPRGELRKEGELGCSVECGDRRGASAQQPQRLTWGLPARGSAAGGEGSCRPSGVGLDSFQGTFRRTASGFLKPLGHSTSEGPVLPEAAWPLHNSFICSCSLL